MNNLEFGPINAGDHTNLEANNRNNHGLITNTINDVKDQLSKHKLAVAAILGVAIIIVTITTAVVMTKQQNTMENMGKTS